jgi:DNA-binding IclR family transcriptional regulator
MKQSSTGRVRSVSRALTILEVMAQQEDRLGLVAISRLVDLDPTTTHRLLRTMQERGFVSQNPIDGKYSLGIRAFQIGNAVIGVTILRQAVRPFIQVLMERTGETANLAIRDGFQAAYVEQATGPRFLRTFSEVGRGIPLHCTAVGKALLIGVSETEIRRLAAQGLERYAPNTQTSLEGLLEEVALCRKQGYALDMEEFEPGARCLGAPITDSDGKVLCAISVAGPAIRMSVERLQSLVPVVVRSAAEVAQALRLTRPVTP